MENLEIWSFPTDGQEANKTIVRALDAVINHDKFIVFENALSKFDRDWFFSAFQNSGRVNSETTQIDVKSLKKFDQTWWEIRYDPQNQNVYKHSKTRQPLHTDNAFLENPPRISLFAMERQVNGGGESTLMPLSALVSILDHENPKLLKELSTNTFKISKGEEVRPHFTPIINLNNMEINWNYYRTDKADPSHARIVEEFFQFLEKLEEDGRIFIRKFNSGDVYIFNDLKHLHARKAFDADASGDRLLCHSMWHVN